jgi:hypothetical protein
MDLEHGVLARDDKPGGRDRVGPVRPSPTGVGIRTATARSLRERGLNEIRMASTSDAVKGTKAAPDLPAWKRKSPAAPPAGIEPADGWTGGLLTPIALAAATGRGEYCVRRNCPPVSLSGKGRPSSKRRHPARWDGGFWFSALDRCNVDFCLGGSLNERLPAFDNPPTSTPGHRLVP